MKKELVKKLEEFRKREQETWEKNFAKRALEVFKQQKREGKVK